jgi:hypothetical protein
MIHAAQRLRERFGAEVKESLSFVQKVREDIREHRLNIAPQALSLHLHRTRHERYVAMYKGQAVVVVWNPDAKKVITVY